MRQTFHAQDKNPKPSHNYYKQLTFTDMGILPGGPVPWTVKVVRLALLAILPGRIVLAVALDLIAIVKKATTGVAIAFAAAANSQIGQSEMDDGFTSLVDNMGWAVE